MSDPDKRSSTADEDETKRIDSTSSSSSSHASSSQIEDVETDPHHGLTRHSTQEDHLAPITAAASRHASRATTTSQLSHSLSRRATNIGTNVTTDPGYEIDWDDDDPENPRNWPLWYKGFAIGTASWSTWVVVLYSTSYTAGIEQMMEEFNITNEAIVTLGVTTYLLGLAIGGVVVAPISETIGRRMTYVVTMFFFLIMVIPCGLATSLEEVIIVRLFGAIAASSMVTLAPGTVADIVDEQHRALAFSIWSLGPLNGPVFGPIIGGFTTEYLGWRWTNWIVMMLAGVAWVLLFILKETYTPVLLQNRAAKRRKETGDSRWWCRYDQKMPLASRLKVNMIRPFAMGLKEPICIFWNLYIAVVYGILYLCFVAYPIVFRQERGWSTAISGLAFIGIGIGSVTAMALEPVFRRIINSHPKDPVTGRVSPEASVSIVVFAAFLTPIGQFWFAWTCVPASIHWAIPIAAGIPFGMGTTCIFIYASNYLTASYGVFASSALAGNAVMRSFLGGTLPLAGQSMYGRLGANWASTLLAFLEVVIIPIPIVFYRYGKGIREKSALIASLRADELKMQGKRAQAAALAEAREEVGVVEVVGDEEKKP